MYSHLDAVSACLCVHGCRAISLNMIGHSTRDLIQRKLTPLPQKPLIAGSSSVGGGTSWAPWCNFGWFNIMQVLWVPPRLCEFIRVVPSHVHICLSFWSPSTWPSCLCLRNSPLTKTTASQWMTPTPILCRGQRVASPASVEPRAVGKQLLLIHKRIYFGDGNNPSIHRRLWNQSYTVTVISWCKLKSLCLGVAAMLLY